MVCERCGYEIAENYQRPICPVCGTRLPEDARTQAPSGPTLHARRGASMQTTFPPEPSPSESPTKAQTGPRENAASQGHRTFSQQGTFYLPGDSLSALRSPDKVLLIEFVLSLVGIFGIGWLLAGEMLIGFMLLACSLLIYWPIMILGTLFTLGFGLICLGPFAVSAILCNAFLFSQYLKRKHTTRRY